MHFYCIIWRKYFIKQLICPRKCDKRQLSEGNIVITTAQHSKKQYGNYAYINGKTAKGIKNRQLSPLVI